MVSVLPVNSVCCLIVFNVLSVLVRFCNQIIDQKNNNSQTFLVCVWKKASRWTCLRIPSSRDLKSDPCMRRIKRITSCSAGPKSLRSGKPGPDCRRTWVLSIYWIHRTPGTFPKPKISRTYRNTNPYPHLRHRWPWRCLKIPPWRHNPECVVFGCRPTEAWVTSGE